MEKTLNCIVGGCGRTATVWNGRLIKSRDYVSAGFCEEHKDTICPHVFGKKDCYGIYNKTIILINNDQ